MNVATARPPVMAARLGGAMYIASSVGFMLVFAWLATKFGYPDVLDQPASDVLPRLLALGDTGRLVWILYALLPLVLIPAAVGASAALRWNAARSEGAIQVAVLLQVVSALAMTLGLGRWSTAQWVLAEAWPLADAAQQATMSVLFDGLNSYLGNGIGEFVGELALYGSFAAFATALWDRRARWMAAFAMLTAVAGWIGMFRNMTTLVQSAADVTNVLLPVFLIAFGVAVMRGSWNRTATPEPAIPNDRPNTPSMALRSPGTTPRVLVGPDLLAKASVADRIKDPAVEPAVAVSTSAAPAPPSPA